MVTPSRRSSGWAFTPMKTYRSPGSPALRSRGRGAISRGQHEQGARHAERWFGGCSASAARGKLRSSRNRGRRVVESLPAALPALTAAPRRPRRARAACCPRPRPEARAARCAWCRCSTQGGRGGAQEEAGQRGWLQRGETEPCSAPPHAACPGRCQHTPPLPPGPSLPLSLSLSRPGQLTARVRRLGRCRRGWTAPPSRRRWGRCRPAGTCPAACA